MLQVSITTNFTILFLVTFGNGSEQISRKTPADFNFSTSISADEFAFVNSVPKGIVFHTGALDHTPNDDGGYMFFINVGTTTSPLFNYTYWYMSSRLVYLWYDFLDHVH